MNADEYARRCLARARGQAPAFELPTPTVGDYMDWLLWLRQNVEEYAPWYRRGEAYGHMIWEKQELEAVERFFADWCSEHAITPEHWHNLLVSRGNEPRAWQKRLRRWQPFPNGTASNGQAVYTLDADTGGTIWLTFEGGQWVQHPHFPYA